MLRLRKLMARDIAEKNKLELIMKSDASINDYE